MFRSIRWKRHRAMVVALLIGLLVLVVGFGNTRVSAITSSERHTTDAFISNDIKGRGALFDDGTTHTVALHFTADDYARLIAAYQTEGEKAYIEASITIDGTTISPVGLRLKGNSTIRGLRSGGRGGPSGNVTASDPTTLPWLVSFDQYVKGQRYQGYREIAIRPVLSMQSGLNEALALRLIAAAGQPSQAAAYAAVTVNGSAPGLRLLVDVPGDNYADANFNGRGVLYKALSTGKFTYQGDDPLAYANAFKQITRKGQQDLKPLITLLQWVSTATDAEFAANLDRYVEVDSLARYVALMQLLNNFDDMSGPGQNYYLWYSFDTGKFSVLAWDLNLAFGQGMGGGMGGGQIGGGAGPGGNVIQAPPGHAGQPGAGNPPGGGFGGRGGNPLKERFVAASSTTFKEHYRQAYAEMYAALYGSGAADAELDRLAGVVRASKLIQATTLDSELTRLRSAIATRKAQSAP